MAEAYQHGQTPLLSPNTSTFYLQSVFINLAAGHGLDKQQWNALIGIVTAIVGNVLISFALNIQRYAHIRLNREEKRWQSSSKLGLDNGEEYSRQIEVADERSKLNANVSGKGDISSKEPDEQTSLMNGNHHRRKSNTSEHPAQSDQSDANDSSDVDNDDDHHKSTYLKSPWWWAGIILMTVGEAGNFLA